MAEWRLRELCYVQSVEYSVVHCSVVQSEPAVVMVLCGLWSVHLTTPDLRTRRTEGVNNKIYISLHPSSLPASLPPSSAETYQIFIENRETSGQ